MVKEFWSFAIVHCLFPDNIGVAFTILFPEIWMWWRHSTFFWDLFFSAIFCFASFGWKEYKYTRVTHYFLFRVASHSFLHHFFLDTDRFLSGKGIKFHSLLYNFLDTDRFLSRKGMKFYSKPLKVSLGSDHLSKSP